jgi:prepilin-type N-terminal cleavage/methylation domain-containing protein
VVNLYGGPGWKLTSGEGIEMRRGFSLMELVVVLIVLALAAALAVPALTRRAERRGSELASLLLLSREAAARRGETVHLDIAPSGAWTITGAASGGDGPIRAGRVDSFPGLPLTLIVSPVGTCGFDARSAKAASVIRLDPLSCTLLD